ncbi:tetratricopeptide repeat protein [Flavobacteriaceae bacterium]|nr:tetratricopeptide repeat protein [Flavobacteriaceae bacterium]
MSYSLKNTYHTYIGNSHHKTFLKRTCLYIIIVCSAIQMTSQTKVSKALEQDAIQAALHLSQGALAIENNEFITGEVAYRKAIAIEENKATGSYNLGNAYYNNSKNEEALSRFVNAAKVATTKPQAHQAFHNLGNALMNQKEYSGAVEAYKNALRNNPSDDQSRYNLALAKDLLEKNPPQEGEDDQEKEQDNQDKKDQQDKKDDQDKNQDQEKDPKDNQDPEGKKGDEQEDKKEPQEPKDPKDEQAKQDKQQQQPADGQLSPQQVKNLLESMNNQEKKVQDKINAKKQKGVKIKSEKDW